MPRTSSRVLPTTGSRVWPCRRKSRIASEISAPNGTATIARLGVMTSVSRRPVASASFTRTCLSTASASGDPKRRLSRISAALMVASRAGREMPKVRRRFVTSQDRAAAIGPRSHNNPCTGRTMLSDHFSE